MTRALKRIYAPIPPEVERVGKAVLDAAFKVHTLGFLINFNVLHLKDGIKRMVV
jgi:hypothetical protein